MKSKVYPAFGYLIARQFVKAGEIIEDEMLSNNIFVVHDATPGAKGKISSIGHGYVWFLCSGLHSYRNVNTGEIDLHEPGWCNLVKPMSTGTFEFESITDSEFVCFAPTLNKDRNPKIPDLEFVDMQEGESRLLPIGTKLYVLEGELFIGDKTIPSMRQVNVKNHSVEAIATRKTYGYIFKV